MLDAFFEALNEVEKKRQAGHYEPEPTEQRRVRIRLAMAAYAYEYYDEPIMTDAEFDALSLRVDTSVDTGNEEMDEFFRKEFDPSTGSWIGKHPGLERLDWIYNRYIKKDKRR